MTREKKFAMLVQTGAILQDLTSRLSGKGGQALAEVDALDAVGRALELREEEIPADVTGAARELLDWVYGLSPAPGWLPDRVDAASRSA